MFGRFPQAAWHNIMVDRRSTMKPPCNDDECLGGVSLRATAVQCVWGVCSVGRLSEMWTATPKSEAESFDLLAGNGRSMVWFWREVPLPLRLYAATPIAVVSS